MTNLDVSTGRASRCGRALVPAPELDREHKRCHTVVAVDDAGRKLAERTIGSTTADHLAVLTWAEQFGAD